MLLFSFGRFDSFLAGLIQGRRKFRKSGGGRHNLPLLVEIGIIDLSKSGGAMALLAPPAPLRTTGLSLEFKHKVLVGLSKRPLN